MLGKSAARMDIRLRRRILHMTKERGDVENVATFAASVILVIASRLDTLDHLVTEAGQQHAVTGRPRHCCARRLDRKSTRLNSSHSQISYAVFCLKKKNN